MLKGGKRQFGGRPGYAGSIRHRDPVQCNHGALGRLLVWTYTIGGAPFPDPGKGKVWRKTPLWPGNDPARSISYTQHAEALKGFLAEAGIITGKLTHAFRAFKAQDLDEQGVSDEVIARLGRWLRTALTTSYLRFFKPAGLLAASGWDSADYASFFAARFHMDVPAALVAEIMPFLAPLQQQVKDLGKDAKTSARGMPAVLSYLAEIVVQDACELLSSADPALLAAAKANPVHQFLLTKELFRDTLKAYQQGMADGTFEAAAARAAVALAARVAAPQPPTAVI